MRIPGLINNVSAETLYFQHQDVIESCRARNLEWERWRGARRGCPWGCGGSGAKEIALHEYASWEAIPDVSEIVWPHGLIVTPCECSYHRKKGGRDDGTDDEAEEGD